MGGQPSLKQTEQVSWGGSRLQTELGCSLILSHQQQHRTTFSKEVINGHWFTVRTHLWVYCPSWTQPTA